MPGLDLPRTARLLHTKKGLTIVILHDYLKDQGFKYVWFSYFNKVLMQKRGQMASTEIMLEEKSNLTSQTRCVGVQQEAFIGLPVRHPVSW